MKLGHDFGIVPFGFHQVLAHRRRRRGFGNETAAATGERDARARLIRDHLLDKARDAAKRAA